MKIPKELTKVTPFSKYLAMALFIILPVFTFWLGIRFATPKALTATPNVYTAPSAVEPTTINSSNTPDDVFSDQLEPVVVFDAPLSNTDHASAKNELTKKVVNPLLDYYAGNSTESEPVSVLISDNNSGNLQNDFPYKMVVIFKNGGSMDALLEQHNGILNWWLPTCQKCVFSDSFKQKYPEIMKNFP